MDKNSKIHIIEKFLKGKAKNPLLCEDAFVINDSFIAVIDGSTNKSEFKIKDKSPGKFIAEVIQDALYSCPHDYNIEEIIDFINTRITSIYKEMNLYEKFKNSSYITPNAAMVIFSIYYNKIWIIGDCQCLVGNTLFENPKIIDEITANARSLYIAAELKSGKTLNDLLEHDAGREYIIPLLRKQYSFLNTKDNTPYTFSAITGFFINLQDVREIDIPDHTQQIVLASDGYPILKGDLEDSEMELERIILEDPLCYNIFKSTKGVIKGNSSFDDRTYIRFNV